MRVRAAEIKDFHPISLVSGLYKIIAKVLANRLQYVLEHIISRTQNDFIKGCQILDFFLLLMKA
jgi:hypothetical protein